MIVIHMIHLSQISTLASPCWFMLLRWGFHSVYELVKLLCLVRLVSANHHKPLEQRQFQVVVDMHVVILNTFVVVVATASTISFTLFVQDRTLYTSIVTYLWTFHQSSASISDRLEE